MSDFVAVVDYQKVSYELEVVINQILSCVRDIIPKGAQAVRNLNVDWLKLTFYSRIITILHRKSQV